jgi:hypothetical protein
MECFFGLVSVGILDKCFPNLSLLKNEDFNDGSMRAEELIKIVVCNDISILVVDTYQ